MVSRLHVPSLPREMEEAGGGWGLGCVPAEAGVQGRRDSTHLLSPSCLPHRPFAEICTEAKQTGKGRTKNNLCFACPVAEGAKWAGVVERHLNLLHPQGRLRRRFYLAREKSGSASVQEQTVLLDDCTSVS